MYIYIYTYIYRIYLCCCMYSAFQHIRVCYGRSSAFQHISRCWLLWAKRFNAFWSRGPGPSVWRAAALGIGKGHKKNLSFFLFKKNPVELENRKMWEQHKQTCSWFCMFVCLKKTCGRQQWFEFASEETHDQTRRSMDSNCSEPLPNRNECLQVTFICDDHCIT